MELRIGGHKTVHADYVSYICQILVLYNVGPYAWDGRRLRILMKIAHVVNITS